jgi:hypothetical protein
LAFILVVPGVARVTDPRGYLALASDRITEFGLW